MRNDGKKGDLSRFVDEALRGRVLDLAARRVKDRNVGYDERRFSILIGEEVDATRGGRSSHQHPRRRPHHKGGSAGPARQQFTLARKSGANPFTVRDLLVEGRSIVRDDMLTTVAPVAVAEAARRRVAGLAA